MRNHRILIGDDRVPVAQPEFGIGRILARRTRDHDIGQIPDRLLGLDCGLRVAWRRASAPQPGVAPSDRPPSNRLPAPQSSPSSSSISPRPQPQASRHDTQLASNCKNVSGIGAADPPELPAVRQREAMTIMVHEVREPLCLRCWQTAFLFARCAHRPNPSARYALPARRGGRDSAAMIVLFTDFGLAGPYTGQVVAVLQREAPGVPAISLFADAPAGPPKPSSYLLAAYAAWFPAGTVLLCVVDPGVGGERRAADRRGRRAILCRAGQWLVRNRAAPRRAAPRNAGKSRGARSCCRRAFTAATCSLRLPPGWRAARRRRRWRGARRRKRFADWPDDLAEIVYIDHYGNAITGMRGEAVAATASLACGGRKIAHARTFSAVPPGRRSGTSIRTGWSRSPSMAAGPTGCWASRSAARSMSRRPDRPADSRDVPSPACARRGTAARPG